MKQNDLINDLQEEQAKAYQSLYNNYFGQVKNFVCNNKGSLSDAEDVFQDTMFVLVQKIRKDQFRLTASMGTYIVAIAKNIWLNKLRHQYRQEIEMSKYNHTFFEEIDQAIEQEKYYKSQLQQYLYKVSKHCQSVIEDVFFKGKSTEQIQKEYGYSSKHNAANQKYKCVEQLKRLNAKK